ncbi:hypothetical protein KDA11_02320, partial [Candidatus Saccharibacteria bacterium]|nr:hypothetical protein [Candidatus Saccharibacteria bacterium]
SSAALAQTGDSHTINVKIPNLLRLRIVDTGGLNSSNNGAIAFDYNSTAALQDQYINEVNAPTGGLAPTTVTGFGDVIVFSNRTGWNVFVSASTLVFSDTRGLGLTAGAGLDLTDIIVTPSGSLDTGVTSVAGSWDLEHTGPSTYGDLIAQGGKTQGWSSLGFGGSNYKLVVDGDENPGDYDTTVTYTIVGL